jgi:PadR family transcriptional regulator, regulatory protein PadR
MGRRNYLGQFEFMALVAMMRLEDDAYGVAIAREIESAIGRDVALASLYLTLGRLEANGLIESKRGESTPERGGRAKTYFKVTAKGIREVRAARRALVTLWDGVPALRGETR